jgi:tetratricopeptide (TPR) repeat protein
MIESVLNGRYRLEAELGRGGMGIVYRARDLLLHRDVAAKVLSKAMLGTEGRARLLVEARSAAQLNHPNIVAVHDAGEAAMPGADDPVPFIVMELVAGRSLHERPPENLQEALRVAAQLCAALEHAHAHGIIHRDLKPENVLLAPCGAAKLSDFGLARSVASRLTADGTIAGTVFYLAPELALGQECDGRADLYALGVMLYELVTGELPFATGDLVGIISQHLHAPPVPPRARPRGGTIPPALDALILRLLSKKPEERPASAAEVGELLARLASGDPVPDPISGERPELSVLDRIARGRLVARERELAHLRAVWRRAAGGEGQVLLISGEPGVGKSRLVRELVTQVQVGGDRALVGECYAESGTLYAPFAQMVRQALEPDGGGGKDLNLPGFALADLVALAPALRLEFPEVPLNPSLDPQSEQQRLLESIVALCAALTARRPLLLVLEDGHWADSGSLALLRYLARRTRRQPVLIVVTYREVELDETRPFREVLVDLNRERLATRIKLSRLDREGTGRLLAALFAEEITPEFLHGIYRETEGNPFFVEEVCKALVEDGVLTFADGRWQRPSMDRLDVPQSLRLAVQSRVSRLPGEVQDILQMAALLGREFSADVLVEAMGKAGTNEEAVIEGLEVATRAQLVVETGGRREPVFSFVHALIAATLAEVPILRRRRLHRHAAEALEKLHPEEDGALAHHYAAAGDDERALAYSTRAGDRAAAVYANAEAERHYRAALELVQDSSARAKLLGKLGLALSDQSLFEEALVTWRHGIELFAQAGDPDGVACLYARASAATWETGDIQGSLAVCREGMAAVFRISTEPPIGAGMAGLQHETARACHFNGLQEEASSWARKALDLAEQLTDAELHVDCLITLALLPGQPPEEAIGLLRRALEVATPAGLLHQAARAENNLGAMYQGLFDLDRAREHFLRAAELARQTGSLARELHYRGNAAIEPLWLQGALLSADEELQPIRQLLAALPDTGKGATSLSFLEAAVLRYRGQLTEATAILQPICHQLAAAGDLDLLEELSLVLADIFFEMGQEREGEAAAREAGRASGQFWGSAVSPVSLLAAWHAGRGDLEQGRRLLLQAREWAAAGQSLMWDFYWLSRAEAHVAAAEVRWPEALAAFESLVGECRRLGMRWYTARTLGEWAEALLARGEPGDREKTCALLAEAATEFEATGAPFYADQARRRMNELHQGVQG